MNKSIKTDLAADNNAKKLKIISLILVAVGIVTAVSLVFFFLTLYRMKSRGGTPQIYEVRQIGATDQAVLIAWSGSEEAQRFIVRGKSTDGQTLPEMTCDTPFIAVRSLEPNNRYRMEIIPVADGTEYPPAVISCATGSFCRVTEVSVTEAGRDYADISWKSEGADRGFVAVAYALDRDGKRHFTSRQIRVPAGTSRCRISGLLSNLRYTVAVMPKTQYGTVGKSVFTTTEYSDEYKNIKVQRFVICPFHSENTANVHPLKTVEPSLPYQTSLILNGKASSSDTCDMTLYVTDADDQLIVESPHPGVFLNPEDKPAYVHRMMLLSFRSPPQEGMYSLYLTFDGKTVKREPFQVKITQNE